MFVSVIDKIIYIMVAVVIVNCGAGSDNSNMKSYKVAHRLLLYNDLKRDNRSVSAQLFYPVDTDSKNGEIADGRFSIIVFAHGYQQKFSDYRYIYKKLTAKGYILAFLTTEQGFAIDIDVYAQDIVFLQEKLLNSEPLLLNHLKSTSALMGHSTGGGAIYLADNIRHKSDTIISMAALGELYTPIYGTNPIDIAHNITTPSLILSGSKDCITPPNTYQKPLYDNLKGEKRIIIIDGGDHCGFSDSFNCPKAEAVSCGLFFQGDTIDESIQREMTLKYITEWLDNYL